MTAGKGAYSVTIEMLCICDKILDRTAGILILDSVCIYAECGDLASVEHVENALSVFLENSLASVCERAAVVEVQFVALKADGVQLRYHCERALCGNKSTYLDIKHFVSSRFYMM